MIRRWRSRIGRDSSQLAIDWSAGGESTSSMPPEPQATEPLVIGPTDAPSPTRLVQILPWDFKDSFPEPMEQAIEAGVVDPADTHPKAIARLHSEQAQAALAVLRDQDVVWRARRIGIDPATGKAPMTHAAKEKLKKFFDTEPDRLERWFATLMGSYESVFGTKASDAFTKAIRAWHGGIQVRAERSADEPTIGLANLHDKVDRPRQSRRSQIATILSGGAMLVE